MGTTSSIKDLLFGETKELSKLLEPVAKELTAKYPNPYLGPLFASLPYRSITVGSMAIASRLAKDMQCTIDNSILRALGVLCFHISTHDDLIDEPPPTLNSRAALLYAGNISFIEGIKSITRMFRRRKVSPCV